MNRPAPHDALSAAGLKLCGPFDVLGILIWLYFLQYYFSFTQSGKILACQNVWNIFEWFLNLLSGIFFDFKEILNSRKIFELAFSWKGI